MKAYLNETFDSERALYGSHDIEVRECKFDGPADGESALKESSNVRVSDSFFNLRYPFWHDENLTITGSEMTENCRASLWYSKDIRISDSKLFGIKALRECDRVTIEDSEIISPEFGWSVRGIEMKNSSAVSEYFLMRSSDVVFDNVRFQGKYSFQYVENATITGCEFDTKDAFWHAKNVVVKDSVIKGEYLAWYSENITFINCTIIGTQPFCYCKGLKLINCRMEGCDLAFEKSEVEAEIVSVVESIKNPMSGNIVVDGVNELIMDDPMAKGKVTVKKNSPCEVIDANFSGNELKKVCNY